MKNVIILSKCLKVTKINSQEQTYEFHFKGVYDGVLVNRVHLLGRGFTFVKKGEEYVLSIRVVSVEQSILRGVILRVKNLKEEYDRS